MVEDLDLDINEKGKLEDILQLDNSYYAFSAQCRQNVSRAGPLVVMFALGLYRYTSYVLSPKDRNSVALPMLDYLMAAYRGDYTRSEDPYQSRAVISRIVM
jgi:hypothetical protein